MIKKIIKFSSIILVIVILLIIYLSFVGIKTVKFNERITNKVFDINKKISLDLKSVKFLFNPFSFTASISTKNSIIKLGESRVEIKRIKTNIDHQ